MLQQIQRSLRKLVRPIVRRFAAIVRRLLEEPEAATQVMPVVIQAGPAQNCTILLPVPSKLAENVCGGLYEPECIDLLKKIVAPSDVCFDIGGHNGYFTLVLAKLASQGKVVCFEPVEGLAERIHEAIQRSGLSNAKVENVAVAGEAGQLQFRYAGESSLDDSMGYLVRYGGVNTPRSQVQYEKFSEKVVTAVTLDSLKDLSPNFIKIDAEGAEAEILSAGLELLSQSRPRLLIELHGVDLALRCADILGPLGYRAHAIGQRSLMMQTLWVHENDNFGARIVESLSSLELPLVFSSRA
jgi:FkbM family methyltransferase